ncbi:MAG: Zn-dependent exopeptidase M28 [Actinobacteria bacterium]|nr:Zn-dependent exopeptidase M28 [Actinomycetota bacterium]MBU1945016.1 Zn-dependent exopeptidase M28 [Actinomycetota bacterium]MBU2686648.1 Zn-dependent exopeptidase M28 [Actinomycetota bacterium]
MIADRYTDYMYGLIDRVMKEIGPRESCSEEERALGRLFAEEVAPVCETVETERFTCSPKAFVGFFPYLVLLYVVGVVLYFFLPAVSAVLSLIGGAVLFLEVVRYKEFIDPFFPSKEGENVVGTVRPSREATGRVYVSAHFDSAYEFKIWYWFKGFSSVLMGIAFLSVVLLFGSGLARAIVEGMGLPQAAAFKVLGWVLVGVSPVVILFAFFHTKDVVPGAMDDMAGVAVCAGLARYLADARSGEGFYPEHTEVVLLGLSSEEAGLRGAKRFAAAHLDDPLPAAGIFLDGIYDERFFTIFKRELWPGAVLDPELVELAGRAAREGGFEAKVSVLPLGATDASAFALAGIPSVSMCLWDAGRLVPHYHTRHDTIEHIKPGSLAVALQTVINMLERWDGS